MSRLSVISLPNIISFPKRSSFEFIPGRGGGGVFRYMGFIGTCYPKGDGFSAVLFINRVSRLAIFVINRVSFLYSSLKLSMCLRRSYFFFIIDKDKLFIKYVYVQR